MALAFPAPVFGTGVWQLFGDLFAYGWNTIIFADLPLSFYLVFYVRFMYKKPLEDGKKSMAMYWSTSFTRLGGIIP